jgi:hypothetical protein
MENPAMALHHTAGFELIAAKFDVALYSALFTLSTAASPQAPPPGRRHIGLWARQACGLGPADLFHYKHITHLTTPPSEDFRILK